MTEYQEYELVETLTDLGLQYFERGKELQLHNCPFCEDGKKKTEHFSFNRSTGQYKCFKCESIGNLTTFRRDMGIDPFPVKIYKTPDQEKAKEHSKQHDSYYQKYCEARGILPDVLKKYEIGKVIDKKLGVCRTYPYYQDGKIVNIKYVNSKKQMKTEYSAKRVYFGLQHLDITNGTLIVTEGEDDCMALVCMGFDNVLSIPYGAGNYSEEIGKINAKFNKIYTIFDNDRKGQDGAEAFSHKAGIWKCWNVLIPFKDSRECLQNGLTKPDIEKYIEKATQFESNKNDRLMPMLNIVQRLNRYEIESKRNAEGIKFDYQAIDLIIGGLRGGEVLTFIADPGCFKTTLLQNMLIRATQKIAGIATFFSFEMQIESEVERELKIVAGNKSYELRSWAKTDHKNWYLARSMLENTSINRFYVTEENNINLVEMCEIIKATEDQASLPCDITGIDYIDFVKASSSREYEAIKENMNGIKVDLARGLNIPVIVLCQTKRDGDAKGEVTLRDGKGGTAIEAASDYVIGIWREGDDIIARFLKHRRLNDRYAGKPYPYMKLVIDYANFNISRVDLFVREESSDKNDEDWKD